MNPETCLNALCAGTLQNGTCVVCGLVAAERQQQCAREAIAYHARQESAGEDYRSCRMMIQDDGSVTDGPGGVQCWLIPGHQCRCMDQDEARKIAAMTRITFRDAAGNETQVDADLSRASRVWVGPIDHPTVLDREAVDDFMAHNDEPRYIYALNLDGKTHLVPTDEAAAEELRARGIQIARADDEQAMAPLLAVMHPQARGLMESGLARSFERLGRAAEMVTIMQAINNVPTGHRMDSVLHALDVDLAEPKAEYVASWDLASFEANVYHPPGPNEGRQAPPPRREWWTEQWKGKGTPGNGRQKQDKRARKAQKQARKANRSK